VCKLKGIVIDIDTLYVKVIIDPNFCHELRMLTLCFVIHPSI